MTMYLLGYVAIGTVKREKTKKRVTGTVEWVEGYDPVDATIVYVLTLSCVCTGR